MHTPLCGHAHGEPDEYVRAAHEKGIDLITFTCHTPMADSAFGTQKTRMTEQDLPRYKEMVSKARELGAGLGVSVLFGIEAEVSADQHAMDSMDEVLDRWEFDFVLGSLHHQLPAYRNTLAQRNLGDDAAIIEDYFSTLTTAAATGRYDSFAHPDLIRIYGTVKPFDPREYETVIREFLASAAEHGICIEVNTSGWTKGVFEVHPAPIILSWAAESGTDLTIGSDSHKPESVGRFFDRAYDLVAQAGFESICYFEAGMKKRVSLTDMAFAAGPIAPKTSREKAG